MATREELHRLIDRLPDEAIERLYNEVKPQLEPAPTPDDWHTRVRQLRKELYAKYGKITDAVTMLEEVREERMNELMGRR